jgi:phage baseplate assembly protein W
MARKIDYFGFNFPFLLGTTVLPAQSDLRLIKNDLLQLLLTSPGERVMRPTFGTVIPKLPFEPNDIATIRGIKNNVRAAISRFERRVSVSEVVVQSSLDERQYTITVFGSLTRDPNVELSVVASFSAV